MKRVILFHWNQAEAEERAGRLRAAGYEVRPVHAFESGDLRGIRQSPPDAFVFDLSRIPSKGQYLGMEFRSQKATRHVPVVFVGGEREKLEKVKRHLPDATYTEWSRIRADLKQAIANPVADPVAVKPMAGYSGTPLPKKLGIKPGMTVSLLNAPDDFERTLGALPEDVRLEYRPVANSGLVLLFAESALELERGFPAAMRAMAGKSSLWIMWPKKSSGVKTDLTQNDIRAYGMDRGLVDYKICAVDEKWSGLCFARRR